MLKNRLLRNGMFRMVLSQHYLTTSALGKDFGEYGLIPVSYF